MENISAIERSKHLLAYFVYVLLDVKALSFVVLLLNSSIPYSMAQRSILNPYSKEYKDKYKKMSRCGFDVIVRVVLNCFLYGICELRSNSEVDLNFCVAVQRYQFEPQNLFLARLLWRHWTQQSQNTFRIYVQLFKLNFLVNKRSDPDFW